MISVALLPLESALAPDVHVRNQQDHEEEGELGEPEPGELMEGIIRLHERVQAGVPAAYEVGGVAK